MNAARSQQSVECVFCGIVAHDVPATVVYEDVRVLAFLDVAPAADGHTLVVPKNHAQDLLSVSPGDLAAVATASQAVARLLDDRLRPDGFTVFQANRQAGWQHVSICTSTSSPGGKATHCGCPGRANPPLNNTSPPSRPGSRSRRLHSQRG